MRTSIYFYENLDCDSVLYRSLAKLVAKEATGYRIGGDMGFGANGLSWNEAMTLAAQFVVTVLKTESSSVFKELRLVVQEDQPESSLLLE